MSQLTEAERVRIGGAVHSVRAVPAEAAQQDRRGGRERPLHVHLSEQPAENAATQAWCAAELLRSRLLGRRTTAVHATHLLRTDIKALGGSQTSASSVQQLSVILPTASVRRGGWPAPAAMPSALTSER